MKINEVAKLTGITVRTLHHYDDIGLLVPKKDDINGYRYYDDLDIDRLQQILFFRACGFPLKKIKNILENPTFDRLKAFNLQKKHLMLEMERHENMLKNIDKSIKTYKRGEKMSNKEKFQGFDFTKNPYEDEAKRLWGDNVVEESQKYIDKKGEKWQEEMGKDFSQVFIDFAKLVGSEPSSPEAQEMSKKLFDFLNGNFNYSYSIEAFSNIGQMYVEDERFKRNIDKFGEGTAELVSESIKIYVKNKE